MDLDYLRDKDTQHVELIPNKRYTMTLPVQVNNNQTVATVNPAHFIRSIADLIEAGATFDLLPDPLPTAPTSTILHPVLGRKYMKLGPEARHDWVRDDGEFFKNEGMGFDVVPYVVEYDAGTQ